MIMLISSLVSATTGIIDLRKGESYLLIDRNITLINLNEDDDKAIICINNVKTILDKRIDKRLNDVFVDIKDLDNDFARLKVERDCDKKCECDESCDNDLCFDIIKNFVEKTENNEDNEKDYREKIIKAESLESQNNNSVYIIGFIALLIILIVSVFLTRKSEK